MAENNTICPMYFSFRKVGEKFAKMVPKILQTDSIPSDITAYLDV